MSSNSSPSVSMFTKVGDEEIQLGHCHPAQARKLVKEELASWVDGRIFLILRPIYLDVMQVNSAWKGPLDDDSQMSDGELKRRRAWFKSLIPVLADAVANSRSKESRLPFTQEQLMEMSKKDADFQAEMREARERDEALAEMRRAENLAIPDDEVAKFFTDRQLPEDPDLQDIWGVDTEEAAPVDKDLFQRWSRLDGVWHTDPDVSECFNSKEAEPSISTCKFEDVEPQDAVVVNSTLLFRAHKKTPPGVPDSMLKAIIDLDEKLPG